MTETERVDCTDCFALPRGGRSGVWDTGLLCGAKKWTCKSKNGWGDLGRNAFPVGCLRLLACREF
jgi:hypothetical protein